MIDTNKPITKISYNGDLMYLYEGKVEGPDKFEQLINGTLTEITEEDLAGNTKVNAYAFYNQKQLISVKLPDSIETLGEFSFAKCNNLKPFDLSNIKVLERGVFNECGSFNSDAFLQNIYLEIVANSNFFKDIAFRKLKIGGAFNKTFTDYFFAGAAPNLIALEYAEGVESLNNRGLDLSSPKLDKIILPTTLTSIGAQSLRNSQWNNLIIKRNGVIPITAVDSVGGGSWHGTRYYYVVYNYIEEYKSATNWSALASRIYPLVNTQEDLASIDTTAYTKVCVIGNDKGIEDENNYAIYNYTDGAWVKEN